MKTYMKMKDLEEAVLLQREYDKAVDEERKAIDRKKDVGEKLRVKLATGEFPVGANISERYVRLKDGTIAHVKHVLGSDGGGPKVQLRVVEVEEPRED